MSRWPYSVRKVTYEVEDTRVGQITDFDKVTLNIETNGVISPEDSVAFAARILQDQLQVFVNFDEPEAETAKEEEEALPFNKNLLKKVEELELSVRSANCLKNDNIVYIGDLVQKSEGDMHLGMQTEGWPPENIEELVKKVDDQQF